VHADLSRAHAPFFMMTFPFPWQLLPENADSPCGLPLELQPNASFDCAVALVGGVVARGKRVAAAAGRAPMIPGKIRHPPLFACLLTSCARVRAPHRCAPLTHHAAARYHTRPPPPGTMISLHQTFRPWRACVPPSRRGPTGATQTSAGPKHSASARQQGYRACLWMSQDKQNRMRLSDFECCCDSARWMLSFLKRDRTNR